MFKVNINDIRKTSITSFWCFYCQLKTYFIYVFKQVTAGWVEVMMRNTRRIADNYMVITLTFSEAAMNRIPR